MGIFGSDAGHAGHDRAERGNWVRTSQFITSHLHTLCCSSAGKCAHLSACLRRNSLPPAQFVYFGVQLLREAPTLNAGVSAEFEEAEEEVDQAEESMVTPKSKPEAGGTAVAMAADGSGAAVEDVEGGSGGLTSRGTGSNAGESNAGDVAPAAAAHPKAFTKVITTVFSVIFLAEWGDRSQIATIALAAAKDPVGVCVGGVLGHAVSTAIAVIGGRLLATRISERTVAYVGGTLFLLFAVHSFIVGPPGGDEGESFFSFFAPAPKEATLTGMTATGGDKLL